MNLYLISYDLRLGATADDYARMDTLLTGLGARRVLLSQWVLRSNSTAMQIAQHVSRTMDGNDRLVVSEIVLANTAWYNPMVDLNTV